MKSKGIKKETVSYDDLSPIADSIAAKVFKKFGVTITSSNILKIVKHSVFEYGFKCLMAGEKFVFRRFGTFKIKDYTTKDSNYHEWAKSEEGKKTRIKRAGGRIGLNRPHLIQDENGNKIVNEPKEDLQVKETSINFDASNSFYKIDFVSKVIGHEKSWRGNSGKSKQINDVEDLE